MEERITGVMVYYYFCCNENSGIFVTILPWSREMMMFC